MYFKLRPGAGNHTEKDENGKEITYESKDETVIESDKDLCAMFVNKFDKVDIETVSSIKKKTAKKKTTKKPAKKEPEEVINPLGRDVTEQFPKAEEEDLKVFQTGDAFSVVETDEPDKPVHDKPLKKKDVIPFIDKYLED